MCCGIADVNFSQCFYAETHAENGKKRRELANIEDSVDALPQQIKD